MDGFIKYVLNLAFCRSQISLTSIDFSTFFVEIIKMNMKFALPTVSCTADSAGQNINITLKKPSAGFKE